MQAKPFLKCAGGKTQILDEIIARLPAEIQQKRKIKRYVEPFIGGGALFFHLKQNYKIESALLIDNNEDFVLAYKVVQNHVNELIDELQKIETDYLPKDDARRKAFFYQMREKFNAQRLNLDWNHYSPDWITRAAWLIFLNKTCFNGLYRQNQKGGFNVPYGSYKKPAICQAKNLAAVHRALKNVEIQAADFTNADSFIREKTLVYFDPPYRPLSKTAYFTAYSKFGFDDENQIRLAQFFKLMHKKGAYLILSNSDPRNENQDDHFFDNLYKGFHIERIDAARMINSVGNKRGKINELLIRNFAAE